MSVALAVHPLENAEQHVLHNGEAQHYIQLVTDQWIEAAFLDAIRALLPETSSLVQENTGLLSQKFRDLATSASNQSTKVRQIVDLADSLELNGASISVDQFKQLFDETLSGAINKMIQVAKMAMTMVYAMDEAIESLREVRKSVRDIQKITRQSNILALNATIEATKAGERGKGFAVVAREVKSIAKDIHRVSEDIQGRIGTIVETMDKGYDTLRQLATTDMSDNIIAKDKLESLTRALVDQNAQFKQVLNETADSSIEISQHISHMTVSMQFQDRVSQQIENAVLILSTLSARMQLNGRDIPQAADTQFVERVLSDIRLSDVRQRCVAELNERMPTLKNRTQLLQENQVLASPQSADLELF